MLPSITLLIPKLKPRKLNLLRKILLHRRKLLLVMRMTLALKSPRM
jgi:hypothetical protein